MTGEVRLRDVTEDDLPILFEHQLDPVANEMAAFPARDWDAFRAHWTRVLADDTAATKTVLFEGDVAGNVVSFLRDGRREVGYWIGRSNSSKRIGTRAQTQILGHVKRHALN